jgi:tetratricopeptide (TPR) repeat protein
VSPRLRAILVTGAVAVAAASAVVAIAARGGGEPKAAPAPARPRAGAPPLALDFGVRADAEARDLRRATILYTRGQRAAAGRAFARHGSLEARIGRVVAAWPDGTVTKLRRLAELHPRSAAVQLNLGLALLWSAQRGGERAVRRAAVLEPDSAYAVAAGNVLYRSFAPNLPIFVPSERSPPARAGQTVAEQLELLARQARSGSIAAKLRYGAALQGLGRPLSARRQFDEGARLAPNDVEAQVAAAVGRFDKANPSAAFSRLGPLARRFPRAATVRFHLGLLLLWMGSVEQGKKELRLATSVQPGSPLAREASAYLAKLSGAGR